MSESIMQKGDSHASNNQKKYFRQKTCAYSLHNWNPVSAPFPKPVYGANFLSSNPNRLHTSTTKSTSLPEAYDARAYGRITPVRFLAGLGALRYPCCRKDQGIYIRYEIGSGNVYYIGRFRSNKTKGTETIAAKKLSAVKRDRFNSEMENIE